MQKNVKYLQAKDLEAFVIAQDGHDTTYWIAESLEKALKQMVNNSEEVIYFPSILVITKLFHTSQLKVYDAFQYLRQHGYDYALEGMDYPIPFWSTCDSCRKGIPSSPTPNTNGKLNQ